MAKKQPAYSIITWGCQMNDDDSRQMASLLESMGYRQAADETEADIVILNTCSVRAKPEQKTRSKLGELRLLKQANRDLIVIMAGCMAQREGEALFERAPHINIILGTANVQELPKLIERVKSGTRRIIALDMPDRKAEVRTACPERVVVAPGLKALVPVMYGCDNFCTYCVVPSARGAERSRLPLDVVREIEGLVSKGCREVLLVGQNVNSYGQTLHEEADFASLLELVNGVEGLERIRFITSHPKDLSDRLIEALVLLPKVCEHVHLPLQSGDDEVLRRMGRGYDFAHYVGVVEKLREKVQGLSLTTDFLVGFPGETEEQFANTMAAAESIRFDAAFTFAFNPRPGTAAEKMEGQLESSVKLRRLRELIAVQNEITLEKNRLEARNPVEVLAEGPSEKDAGKLAGYTRTNKTVIFPGPPEVIGQLVMIQPRKSHPWGFKGEILGESGEHVEASAPGQRGETVRG